MLPRSQAGHWPGGSFGTCHGVCQALDDVPCAASFGSHLTSVRGTSPRRTRHSLPVDGARKGVRTWAVHTLPACLPPAPSPRAVGPSLSHAQAGHLSTRLATSICQLRHDRMQQGPTEPHTGRGTFLLSSGGAGGGYY